MPDRDDPSVSDLRGHIDAAHAAADRLVRDASARAEASDRAFRERLSDVPQRGWDVAPENQPEPAGPSELQVIVSLLGSLRDALPAELTQQVAEAVRDLLLAVRALIDWYLERLERMPRTGETGSGAGEDRVEDIPIS